MGRPSHFAVAFALLTVGCASVEFGTVRIRPGLRVIAVCQTDLGTNIIAYPISPTFAGSLVLLGAVIGGAAGAAGGPAGAAIGAGAGGAIGAVVEIVGAVKGLWAKPDPAPTCPGAPPAGAPT